MKPRATIDDGDLVIRSRDKSVLPKSGGLLEYMILFRVDTKADDWDDQLAAWCAENKTFEFVCSSTIHWWKDNSLGKRWFEAISKAIHATYGSPDFPCIKCGERVGDAVSVMRDFAERANKEPRKPKVCCPCLWESLENL